MPDAEHPSSIHSVTRYNSIRDETCNVRYRRTDVYTFKVVPSSSSVPNDEFIMSVDGIVRLCGNDAGR